MFKKNLFTRFLVAVLLIGLIVANGLTSFDGNKLFKSIEAEAAENAPKYVFYFIGDGLGAAQRQIAEYYKQEVTGDKNAKLLMNTLPVAGINTTYSADTLVTDSAAAGTALATGHKTNNGMISQKPDGTSVKSLIELAEEKGMATGIVTTTRLTHATPAVFAAHNASRNNENDIAVEFLESGVDYFAGGGNRHFVPQNWKWGKSKRTDDRNLLTEFNNKGYTVFASKDDSAAFRKYEPKMGDKVIATLAYSHLPYEIDRKQTDESPSLGEITQKGIELLSKADKGFFLMVEGGRIDHACHANDAVGSIHDTLAFDDAIAKAYEFYQKHPEETLIVVVGDHETGGMGLGFGKNYFVKVDGLKDVKASVEDVLIDKYDGDKEAYFKYIAENFGLNDLTEEEKAKIIKAMDIKDSKKEDYDLVTYGPNYYCPVAVTTTHIISERTNIQWTTYAHSATSIPMSAIGKGAENFGGYKDNTEIAKAMANLMGFELTK
ncbi:alkaline phosphatase [Paramaledivibacter caminithermalis]|jgi:alkaline phosphatase|uniref:Alkaline phosphatase n=1 Tax=Paramaledivibacter caminithermalis (strain DSM 15212 / CIP 107654 / DViRD3) TaxID=1121301 RepID=A0A1M6MNQ9_PARC5|nr:alkaline phosphatase [Paramaledivibacter caminithermalis]SHJ85069.1 alkaline phosphatase [Paramaledivibacter caminithermalis DSM 15212]